jgi:hypothetical protein
MNKFDQTILEYTGNLPAINPDELAKKLAPALKANPQVAKVVGGVGGAMQTATQTDPKVAEILNKLNDPKSQFSPDEINTLTGFMSERGFEFKPTNKQNPTENKPEDEKEENSTEGQTTQAQTSSPSSYGVQDRPLQGRGV